MNNIMKDITKDIQERHDDIIAMAIKNKLSGMTDKSFRGKDIDDLNYSELMELIESLKKDGLKFEFEFDRNSNITKFDSETCTLNVELNPPKIRVYKEVFII